MLCSIHHVDPHEFVVSIEVESNVVRRANRPRYAPVVECVVAERDVELVVLTVGLRGDLHAR